jgi:enoyl-CoA hydratase
VQEPTVLVDLQGGIARVTINRPKSLNALNAALLQALRATLDDLAGHPDLRCVVLTGAGNKAFVAGADIAEMAALGPQAARRFAQLGHETFEAIETLPVPVLVAVNGYALGGGCELTLACDLVYAADTARFGQPEVDLGLIPGFGGTQRLARRVGAMRAAELVFTGRHVPADEAKAMGLCLGVFPAAELNERVLEVATKIAAKGPVAVRQAKRVIRAGLDGPLSLGNALEREAFAVLFDTEDAREGMTAFTEKRKPTFRNA